jgi:transcriptional regulator with XRE-family HTH domain
MHATPSAARQQSSPGSRTAQTARRAERMGTTASVLSRIESGQHRTSTNTLRRLANALDGQAVLGFDFEHGDAELVAL